MDCSKFFQSILNPLTALAIVSYTPCRPQTGYVAEDEPERLISNLQILSAEETVMHHHTWFYLNPRVQAQ